MTIKVFWPREMDSTDSLYLRITMHEMMHLYAMMNSEDMPNAGHGLKASDFMVGAVNGFISEAWPEGHWSWPGTVGN